MSQKYDLHAYLLSQQLAATFKTLHDLGYVRGFYEYFASLITEKGTVISFKVDDSDKSSSSVKATVVSEHVTFEFIQYYRYGRLGELEISYIKDGLERSLHNVLIDTATPADLKALLLIDFEYAISIYTEYMGRSLKPSW